MEAVSSIPQTNQRKEVEEEERKRREGENRKQLATTKRQEEEVGVEKEEPTGWADRADEDGDEDDDKSVGDHKSAHKGG